MRGERLSVPSLGKSSASRLLCESILVPPNTTTNQTQFYVSTWFPVFDFWLAVLMAIWERLCFRGKNKTANKSQQFSQRFYHNNN
jgi:hypothetical protein